MKSKITKVSAIVLSLAVLVVLSTALAEPAGDPVSGSGEAVASMATGQATGTATLVVRGEELAADVAVTLGESYFSDEGVLHGESSHTFTFANGTITTSDKVIGEPVNEFGLFTLNETLTITEGTGDFEGVSGNLTVHGQMQFRYPETWLADVSYNIRGVILIN